MIVEFEGRKECVVKLLERPLAALAMQEMGMAVLPGAIMTWPFPHSLTST